MARQHPYLVRRGNVLHFRISIPQTLRALIGAREFVRSLNTQDTRTAVPHALMLAATAKRLFSDLHGSHQMSEESKRLLDLLKEKRTQIQHREEVDALKDAHLDEVVRLTRAHREESERIKLEVENRLLKEITSARASVPAGEAPASVSTAAPAPAALHTLNDAMDVWKAYKKPAVSSVQAYTSVIENFQAQFRGLPVERIERSHLREYFEARRDAGVTTETMKKELSVLGSVFSFTIHEEWIKTNPVTGLKLPEGAASTKIRSYTIEEVGRIFNGPVHRGEKVRGKRADTPQAYWLPLLLLYTGARREELAQLSTETVLQIEGVHYLKIDGVIKTEESKRSIPIHKDLISFGFLKFVERRRREGGGMLFKNLKPNKRGQYAAKWGDWWMRYLKETIGITAGGISPAHSFRHLFITECRNLKFRPDVERAIVGHARGQKKGDAHDEYGEHLVPTLKEWIDKIDFRGLDLSHLVKRS